MQVTSGSTDVTFLAAGATDVAPSVVTSGSTDGTFLAAGASEAKASEAKASGAEGSLVLEATVDSGSLALTAGAAWSIWTSVTSGSSSVSVSVSVVLSSVS